MSRIAPADLAWALTALAEGVPATWVAETIGVTAKHMQDVKNRHGIPGDTAGWRAVWGHVKSKEHLLTLHREFAPRGTRWTSPTR